MISPFMKRRKEERREMNGDVRDDNQSVTQNHITKLDELFELAKSNKEEIRKMNKFIRYNYRIMFIAIVQTWLLSPVICYLSLFTGKCLPRSSCLENKKNYQFV